MTRVVKQHEIVQSLKISFYLYKDVFYLALNFVKTPSSKVRYSHSVSISSIKARPPFKIPCLFQAEGPMRQRR